MRIDLLAREAALALKTVNVVRFVTPHVLRSILFYLPRALVSSGIAGSFRNFASSPGNEMLDRARARDFNRSTLSQAVANPDNGKSKPYRLSLHDVEKGRKFVRAIAVSRWLRRIDGKVAAGGEGRKGGTVAEKSGIPVRLLAKRSQRSVHGTLATYAR